MSINTQKNIIKLLQQFNKSIDDIELTDDYYLDKFCAEKGFYRLYDDRLKHTYEPIKIKWSDLLKNGKCEVEFLYTHYSANGEKYEEKMKIDKNFQDLIKTYGKETMSKLIDEYIDEKCKVIPKQEVQEELKKLKREMFKENCIEKEETIDMDY